MSHYRCIGAHSQAGVHYDDGDLVHETASVVTSHASKWAVDNTENIDITYADGTGPCINSTDGAKVFRITVNDAGTLAAVEIT